MPLNSCTIDGKKGYKWGNSQYAKCYTYDSEDENSKKEAKKKALAQGIAIGDIEISKEAIEELRYVEAPVHVSNLYKLSNGEEYTLCEQCNEANNVVDSSGFCKSCENPLGDYQGDLMTQDTIEKMMFSYMESINERIIAQSNIIKSLIKGEQIEFDYLVKASIHHVGLGHKIFKSENGCIISSYLKYDPIEIMGEEFQKTSWIQGTKVSEEIFEKIKSGEYQEYSLGGSSARIKLNNIEEE